MRELLLPKYNNNDVDCVFLGWLAEDGARVAADTVVAEVETAKAVEELVAEADGVLHQLVAAGAECVFGQAVGLLFEDDAERAEYLAAAAGEPPAAAAVVDDDAEAPVLSNAARALAEAHGIAMDRLRALGKRVVKTADVERLITEAPDAPAAPDAADAAGRPAPDTADATVRPAPDTAGATGPAGVTSRAAAAEAAEGARVVRLSARQRAVGAVVGEAHRTIPDAFAAIKVDLTAFEAQRADRAAHGGTPYGLVEVLVKAIADRYDDFPLFFASPAPGHTLAVAPAANVGVTIDVGTGLFIPVLKDAGRRPIDDLADDLMDFRVNALRQTFREEAFAGEAITLSLHNDPDIVLAAPIVHPGRTCVVTLCAVQKELRLAEDGTPVERPFTTVAATYDHRYLNGRDAVRFLTEVKQALESADALAGLGR